MSNSTKRHLAIVKSGADQSGNDSSSGDGEGFFPGQVISPEDFTPEISSQVQKAIKNSGIKGVVTGALIGNDIDHDIQPLILFDGRVQLLRYSDHLVSYNSETLANYHAQLEKLKKLTFITASGEFAGQIWVLRPFYKTTLQNTEEILTYSIIESIIAQIKLLHKSGIIHGHICPANVGLEGNIIRLTDIGFSSLSNNSRSINTDLAPEIQAGYPSSISTDIFGLGLILEHIFGSNGSKSSFYTFINSIQSKDPARRPTIQWIEDNLKNRAGTELKQDESSFISAKKFVEDKQNVKVTERPNSVISDSKTSGTTSNLTFLSFILLFAAVIFLGYKQYYNDNPVEQEETLPYQSYWESGDKSLMKNVAIAAVRDSNESARYVINRSAFKGKNENGILSTVIKTAFNPLWENELSEEDRQIIYRIGLGGLLPKELHETKFSNNTHPGVILALVGALDMDSVGSEFSAYKVSDLANLPDPYGKVFEELGKLGIKNMEDKSAKGLSHIATGNVSNRALEDFLFSPIQGSDNSVSIEAKIKIILPLIIESKSTSEAIIEILLTKDNPKKNLLEWFSKSELVVWKNISAVEKLALVAGVLPGTLSFEQKADLLSIDNDSKLQKSAVESLLADTSLQDIHSVINTINQYPGSFTRTQVISLLSALKLTSDKGYQFLSQWFRTNPNPKLIIKILSTRRKTSEVDGFVFEGSRYISANSRSIVLQPEELIAFSTHPETILRAMAYSQLESAIPEHREIMKNAIKIEQNKRLRDDLQERLNLAQ